ncbi:hypothetical protein PVT67_18050 [Gallaecimonas kandeliae]|uniref:hypothetical protein n=1 Tax=Gallaecimonas kandeliae TaxID=3029055 RepID=UPI0026480171|nr:hypothetical protein [Gallaecimonas kandeliae]WKE65543.1 hypothetical protein PVT67_18050 [Gallaecimonas kandeliae]
MKLRYLPLLVLAFGASANIQDKLAQCAQLSDDGLRLACFDALAKQARSQGDMAVAPVTSAEEQALQRPKVVAETHDPVASFGMEQQVEKKHELDSIKAVVVKINKDPYGKLILVLDNGQTWKQGDSGYSGIKTGDTVKLEKGALGAVYLGKDGGGRTIRVSRSK